MLRHVVCRRFKGDYYLHHQGGHPTRRNIPEDSRLRTSRRDNLKSRLDTNRFVTFNFVLSTWRTYMMYGWEEFRVERKDE
jgi:hypothetical protein